MAMKNKGDRKMKPQNSWILIEYEEPKEKKTESGIILTGGEDVASGFLREGLVLEINRIEETENKDIKVGDRVLFNKNAMKANIPNEPNKRLIRKEDIYVVL